MCDLSAIRSSACHGTSRNWLKPVKLSKWELPIPDSKSYWHGVCAEIEKKYQRVRDPYPSLFSLPKSSLSSAKTHHSDDIKVKISPPTPLHKTPKSAIEFQVNKSNEYLSIKDDDQKINRSKNSINKKSKLLPPTPKDSKVKINLPDSSIKNETFKAKIYPKQSCPLHKNTEATKIFDDEITKYLQRPKSSVPKLPSISKNKNVSCQHRKVLRSKSSSITSISSKTNENVQERRFTKAPKLGTASLLPSFAKAISIDSSAGTRESFDSEEESARAQVQFDIDPSSKIHQRDFLRVPNLSFVSAHPSFRKLSLLDSCDEGEIDLQDISVIADERFVEAEKNLKQEYENLNYEKDFTFENEKTMKASETKTCTVNKDEKTTKILKTLSDYENEYSYKALNALTKYKILNSKIKVQTDLSNATISPPSEKSTKLHKIKSKKMKKDNDDKIPIDFREIHAKLKESTKINLDLNRELKYTSKKLDKPASITIYSASRSTSSPSPDFENNLIIPTSDILQTIPETKVFQRSYIDKCHACLYKPFKKPEKIKRELPLTTLKAIVDNPPDFDISSSSSSSTSSTEVLYNCLTYDSVSENFDDLSESNIFTVESTEKVEPKIYSESKDNLRVSFEKKILPPTPESNTQSLVPSDKSIPPKLQPDHHLGDKSLSIQSSDRSKTSTPSNHSSDSEEARPQGDDQLPQSKFMAPCHTLTVWRKSFEPLKALKLKKFMTIRSRDAALTAKSSDGSDSDEDDNIASNKLQSKKQEKDATTDIKDDKKLPEEKKKKKKPLIRMKTVAEKMTSSSPSFDVAEIKESKGKRILKRAKTTFDLIAIADDDSKSESSDDEKAMIEQKPEIEKENEKLPLSELILMHRAGSPPPPIMTIENVIEIVTTWLENDPDLSKAELLNKLSQEFANRIKERFKNYENDDDKKCLELGLNLFKALIDSRRYLMPDSFDPNLEFSQKQPPLSNSRQLRRILPLKCYELVAPILGMPRYAKKEDKRIARIRGNSSSEDDWSDSESDETFDLVVHPPTPPNASADSEGSYESYNVNPYALFLKKPRRKVVVWRPLREEDLKGYDPEATLEMRAARLMDRICKEFCDWLKQLGGTEQVIDEETLKDMFEINFSAEACKAMQVNLKEMPTVPEAVVKVRHSQEASELAATRRQIENDLKAEYRQQRTHAFGRTLPPELRFVPPRTRLSGKWLDCPNIPQDLATMDVIWNGIMHLDSVQSFINYLKQNPEIVQPQLLNNLKNRKANVITSTQPSGPEAVASLSPVYLESGFEKLYVPSEASGF